MPDVQHITRTGHFLTTVAELTMLSPRMRRITLAAPEITGRHWPLGCDIAVVLTGPDGREVRRRYTVRSSVGEQLVIDAVLHGHGPGSSWAQELRVGGQVSFFGPRGELPLPAASWLLALTDEAGLPAIAALAEAAGAAGRGLRVLAEISDDGERYPLPANAEVQWLARDGRPAGQPDLLVGALDRLRPGAGPGYAYVLGESRAILTVRDELARLGLSRSEIYAKGYWNHNSRSTR
ncbi:MAG TPA: siderophore-interacting protein [Jatrophihabitans sp.]|jgi:NADPH-dependent ferric siderophore reductase|uniref:siderophore-interacting protein n=1 Tax=Jatrophihabitans sp. TaxID=1932789 RepID=UPI002EF6A5DE